MPGFTSKYYYTVDPKGRVMIPAPFRSILAENYSSKLVVTNAPFDKCLNVYPLEEWQIFEEKVKKLPSLNESVKYLMRRVVGSVCECELDRQGRLLIPVSLRTDAEIDGEVAVVGQINRIEIWNKHKWDEVVDPTRIDIKAYEVELASLGL